MDESQQIEMLHSPEEQDGDESDTTDDQNSDHCSSGEDEYDSDDSEMCRDIVDDVRDLAKRDKVEVLIELVKSRTDQLRLHRQLEVFQYAFDVLSGEKLKLQLDLALTSKTLLVLREALTEQRKQDEKVLTQINITSDFISDLDMKRVQLIKEIRQLANQFVENKSKGDEMVKKRVQEEVNRSQQLQDQLDAVYVNYNDLKQKLAETDEARQSLAFSLSEHMNEQAKLTEELCEARKLFELEVQTNAKLKENVEMYLSEKTQLATEVLEMENRIAEQEQAHEAKLLQMEQSASSQLLELKLMNDAKMAELEQAWQYKYDEEMKNAVANLTEVKAQKSETEKQNATMNEIIEKMKIDLESSAKNLEQEKDRAKELETKIGGMQTMLEDRNNEICSLYSKLNGEYKRSDEEREKIEELNTKLKTLHEHTAQKIQDLESQLTNIQKEAVELISKKEQLEVDIKAQSAKISELELKISEKDKEDIIIQEKLTAAEKDQDELKKLKVQAAENQSTITALEDKLKSIIKEEIQTNNENINNISSAQITSTPLRLSNSIDDSLGHPPSKRIRIIDTDTISIQSSVSNYTSFQGNVERRRDTGRLFAKKSPIQIKRKDDTKSFFNRSMKLNSEDDLISLGSTVNLDEEPLETANISGDSPVPLVKPFFRRQPEKK